MIFFLFLLAVLVNIKSIFLDCEIDVEYALAMSYRMLQGDGMFAEMREPHQTSAFLCTFLMKPFVALTGGTTGIVVYLNVMGVLLHAAVVWLFYSYVKRKVPLNTARLMSIFLLAVRPKDIVFPEFSNMQMWFCILLFLSLLYYLEHQKQKVWLLVSSVCLCMEVISYPSCVVVWLSVVIVLGICSRQKGKDIGIFTGACALQGGAWVWYFVKKAGGIRAFTNVLEQIVSGDESHRMGENTLGAFFWENLIYSFLWLGGALAAAFVIVRVGLLLKKREGIRDWFVPIAVLIGWCGLILRLVTEPNRTAHVSLYVAAVLWSGYWLVKNYQNRAADVAKTGAYRIVLVGTLLSVGSFVSTLLLTNLDISSTLMYLILGVAVAFIPLGEKDLQKVVLFQKTIRFSVVIFLCFLCLFQRGVYVKTLGGFSSPFMLGGIVKDGPQMGIVADYMGANVRNVSYEEWGRFVEPGDGVLIVESGGASTIAYLFADTYVSAPSTICTPSYKEPLLEYWEQYPQKYPDVVAVRCTYGQPEVDEDSFIMNWLATEYGASVVEDGSYWRFYRR